MVYQLSIARANRSDRASRTVSDASGQNLRDRPLRAIWRLDPVTRRPEMFWTCDSGTAAQGRASECL
jgi:hypothetical protein